MKFKTVNEGWTESKPEEANNMKPHILEPQLLSSTFVKVKFIIESYTKVLDRASI